MAGKCEKCEYFLCEKVQWSRGKLRKLRIFHLHDLHRTHRNPCSTRKMKNEFNFFLESFLKHSAKSRNNPNVVLLRNWSASVKKQKKAGKIRREEKEKKRKFKNINFGNWVSVKSDFCERNRFSFSRFSWNEFWTFAHVQSSSSACRLFLLHSHLSADDLRLHVYEVSIYYRTPWDLWQ